MDGKSQTTNAVTLKASTVLDLWGGSDCPLGWIESYGVFPVIGRAENGWPIVNIWGRSVTINPELIEALNV
jgi:hypothetical protein